MWALRKVVAQPKQIRQRQGMKTKPSKTFLSLIGLTVCLAVPYGATAADAAKPIHALLVTGGCCHDYTHQKKILTEGISARANVEWAIVHEGDGKTDHRISIYEKPD